MEKLVSPSLVTLTTDFGLRDSYVGVIKGVMAMVVAKAGRGPLQFVDVTHGIAPQDVMSGRFHLAQAVPHFPPGTVHLAVVDPGVGGERRAIAVEFERGWLVGPDNGLFSGVLAQFPARAAVELNRPEFWRTAEPSQTFHGRDIFAPVAVHLACGVGLEALGEEIAVEGLVRLDVAEVEAIANGWRGSIQYIDYFGNAVTTISGERLQGCDWFAEANELRIAATSAYGQANLGRSLALVGSHGWVEIAVNGGSAAVQLGLAVGDEVLVRLG